ncbi:MAG TPA: tripartite tricarboxylate transporter substrate binding protein [Rectinemataceae bacterium]|nr:tripartite tricarboxylate transporter substrate binding protein [Rectinemataceae bacterium]
MKSKNLFVSAVVFASLAITLPSLTAQNYPRRPIEMVIPFGTGGASDIFARNFAQIASKYIGKPFTPVNKGGAGTIEGMMYSFGAPADGYTILEITPSLLIVEAQNKSSIKFRQSFEPIMRVQSDVVLFGVKANSNLKTLEDMIAFAKANPRKLKIGGISPGGLDEYIARGFAAKAGIEWTYVPYKSASELKAAVLGGELDIYQDKLISFMSMVSGGDIRPLVVLSDKRLPVPELKDVPCSVEKGLDFTQGSWRGFVVKKGTPPEIKKIIIDAFEKAYADPAYKDMEKKEMTDLLPGYLNAADFGKLWDSEFNGYVAIFKQMGLIK